MSDVVDIKVNDPFEDEWDVTIRVLNDRPFYARYKVRCVFELLPTGHTHLQFNWTRWDGKTKRTDPNIRRVLEEAVTNFLRSKMDNNIVRLEDYNKAKN